MQAHSGDACGQSSKAEEVSSFYGDTCTCSSTSCVKNLNQNYPDSSFHYPQTGSSCKHFEDNLHGYQHHQPTAPAATSSSYSNYEMTSSSSTNHPHQSAYLGHLPSSMLPRGSGPSSSANHHHYIGQKDGFGSSPSSQLSSENSPRSSKLVAHVYELPYDVRRAICDLLDADNSWRHLGGRYMGFNETQLTLISHALFRGDSPTNQLLMKWESSNGKVAQLYGYLGHMKHRRAMQYLVPFVEEKWRLLYEDGVTGSRENVFQVDHQHGFNVGSGGGDSHNNNQQQPNVQQRHFYRQHSLNSQKLQNQHSFTTDTGMPPPPFSMSTSYAGHGENMANFESNLASELLANRHKQQMNHQQAQQSQNRQQNHKHHVEFAGGSPPDPLLPTFTGSFSGKPNFAQFGHQGLSDSKSNQLANEAPNFSHAEGISQNRHFLHELSHHLRHAKTSFSGGDGSNSGEGDRTLVDITQGSSQINSNDHHHQQSPFSEAASRLKKEKLEYLVRIEDFEIPYKELAIATDDFCKEHILGSGGFGTVYIGEWKGTKVAVKKLKGLDNSAQAFTELRVLNCCRIDNILPLYAVALDGPEPCLVYQYMCNGSLEDRLLCKGATTPLTWIQRAKIGEGVARALNFLHTLKGNPFVHGDVKSANILLDAVFEPKLGDFGLARKVEKRGGNGKKDDSLYTHCTVSSVNGTSVYLPSEYLRNKMLSPAVDVYSYGIVILEMATGRRAYDGKRLLINSVEDEYNSLAAVLGTTSKTATTRALKVVQTGSPLGDDLHEPSTFVATSSTSSTAFNVSTASTNNIVHENLMDKRIVHLPEDRHWFNCLLELGRKCAHKIKSKRPLMVQVLEYFNQCKTTDRIHKLADKRSAAANMAPFSCKSVLLKNPLELQLWYDFVRQSCGPHLSDVVFENFGAQVTRMIEDFNSSKSVTVENLFCSKNKQEQEKKASNLKEKKSFLNGTSLLEEKFPNVSSTSNLSPSKTPQTLSTTNSLNHPNSMTNSTTTSIQTSNSTNSSSSNSLSPLHLPQLLHLMTIASSDDDDGSGSSTAISSTSTIEDELSLFSGSDVDPSSRAISSRNSSFAIVGENVENVQKDKSENFLNVQEKEDELTETEVKEKEYDNSSMPFIPLLTALGFANDFIEEIVFKSGKLKSVNNSSSNCLPTD